MILYTLLILICLYYVIFGTFFCFYKRDQFSGLNRIGVFFESPTYMILFVVGIITTYIYYLIGPTPDTTGKFRKKS